MGLGFSVQGVLGLRVQGLGCRCVFVLDLGSGAVWEPNGHDHGT